MNEKVIKVKVSCVGTLMDRVHFPRILMTVFF